MKSIYFFYSLLSALSVAYLIFLLVSISKTKMENKRSLVFPIFVAIIAISSYTMFLGSRRYFSAVGLYGIYCICADWMTFSLFCFFSENVNSFSSREKIKKLFFAGVVIDSASLIVNNFSKHSFDLIPSMTVNELRFWWLDFSKIHYVHIGFCYVMAISTFVVLVLNYINSPRFYRKKYVLFFVTYIIVLLCNFHSYSMNLPIDYSVLLYGIFATFLAVYSIKAFPSYLKTNVMEKLSDSLPDAIIHFDYEENVIYKNESAKRLLNSNLDFAKLSLSEFKEKYLSQNNGEMSVKWENGAVSFSVDLNLDSKKFNQFNAGKNNAVNLRITYQELKIEDMIVGSYIKISDKTKEKLRYQEEKYAATHDELTGLLNRAGFFEEVEKNLKKGVYKNPLMICSNIKDFKVVNDIFGETAGDEILLNHASVLNRKAKENDVYARLCDDKFAIFMEKSHFNSDDFKKEFLSLSHMNKDNSYQMFISAGVYEVHDIAENVQLMYDKAKVAMDTVKDDYLTALAFYDSVLMDKLLAEKNIINNFEDAIIKNHIEMYLQPVFDENGSVVCAEALCRWNSPEVGIIYPADFIDILEHTGLIYKLDKFICGKAIEKFAEWKKKGYGIKSLAVNASSRDEYYFDTISFLKSEAEKNGISPDSIFIEVRENALINDYETGTHYFSRLKEAGFKVTIDGFGSGYSSLNMLKDFSVDAVKISADFFSENENSSRAEIILRSMIDMVKSLKIKAVALGIENEDQKNNLAGMGCSFFQGYLFSKPITAEEFEEKFLKT